MFVDDLPLNEDTSLSEFIKDPKYAGIYDDYVMVDLPKEDETQDLTLPEMQENDYTKFILNHPIEDLYNVIEELPESVRYLVLTNANLEYIPAPP